MLNQEIYPSDVCPKPLKETPLSKFNGAIARLNQTLEIAKGLRRDIANEDEPECADDTGKYQCIAAALNNGPEEIEALTSEIDRQLEIIRRHLL